MKKIAILGGSRFIGFHLITALHKQGYDITIFNRRLTPPPAPFPKGIKFTHFEESLKSIYLWLNKNPQKLEYFSLRGEKYILYNRPIPFFLNVCWKLSDSFLRLARKLKGFIKRILK